MIGHQWLKSLFARLFKSKVHEPIPYAAVNPHLAQGDIFGLSLVTPLADDEIRILRTETGLHGTHVFAGEPGRIFGYDDLLETIDALPREELPRPFHNRGGIPLEKVVVFGDLVEYFMIASQTCDVSGIEKNSAKTFAAIVPVIPVSAFLSRERLPIGLSTEDVADETQWSTIVDYLQTQLSEDLSDVRDDAFVLPARIRELLGSWKPPKKTTERQIRGRIVNVLSDTVNPRKNYIYYLPANTDLRVPEAYVDFTRLFSVVTEKLQQLMPQRVCTLATPYREEFASKLGSYLSRIATPVPLTPPNV